MTDETGGKPLFDGLTVEELPSFFDRLAVAHGTGMPHADKLELASNALRHTIGRAEAAESALVQVRAELIAAAEECAKELEFHIGLGNLYEAPSPKQQLLHDIDMAPVRRLRAAVAKVITP